MAKSDVIEKGCIFVPPRKRLNTFKNNIIYHSLLFCHYYLHSFLLYVKYYLLSNSSENMYPHKMYT